jgi:Flp pilus assembly protein CpaB
LRRTSRLVLLAGVFLAALTFVVILFLQGGPGGTVTPTATPPPANLPTVVASVDIPLGTVITADMVTTRTMPVDNQEPGALGDVSQAIGHIVATDIATGGQVTRGDFLVRDVELSVPAGLRGIAVAVNELSGVAKLVTTGDSVDVIVTFNIDVTNVLPDGTIAAVSGITAHSTKMVLQDVQVIGKLDQYVPPAEGQTTPAAPGYVGGFPGGTRLLILAVTPQQAEVLAFSRYLNAQNDFNGGAAVIDLVLRSPEDAGIEETTTGVILSTLIDQYGVLPPEVVIAPFPTEKP